MSGKRSGRNFDGFIKRLIAKVGRPVIRHLSELAGESLKRPGSWRCLEIVYRNEPKTMLDHFFLGSRSAKGARNRLDIFREELFISVKDVGKQHNPVRVISLGSGPGHEILSCMERLQGKVEVKATCMDKDGSALERGRAMAKQRGLEADFRYVRANVLCLPELSGEYDIAIMSGLLDYFDFETAVSVLRRIKKQLRPGGTILTANMRQHQLASTMSILGNWKLVYREPQELEGVLAESGYEKIKVWLEPEKVFCIGKAKNLFVKNKNLY